jgi:hypothetical protein
MWSITMRGPNEAMEVLLLANHCLRVVERSTTTAPKRRRRCGLNVPPALYLTTANHRDVQSAALSRVAHNQTQRTSRPIQCCNGCRRAAVAAECGPPFHGHNAAWYRAHQMQAVLEGGYCQFPTQAAHRSGLRRGRERHDPVLNTASRISRTISASACRQNDGMHGASAILVAVVGMPRDRLDGRRSSPRF